MTTVFDFTPAQQGKSVHRAALLAELLKPIDENKMYVQMPLTKMEDLENHGIPSSLLCYFDNRDYADFEFDAVIGADGVHGYCREYVLGKEHPALKAQRAGFWDARAMLSMQKAKEILGDEYFEKGNQRQNGWIGNGGFFMCVAIDNETQVNCILAGIMDEEWKEDEWKKPMDRESLEKALAEWDDVPIKRGIIEVGVLQ